MNRSTTLAAALLVAGSVALPGPAAAQRWVHDPIHMAETIARGVNEVRELQRQYNQLAATYQAFTGPRALQNLTGRLGTMTSNPLPGTHQVPGLLNGSGQMFGWGGQMMQQNRAYTPQTSDAWTVEMERRERATANIQGMIYAGMHDAQAKVAALGELAAAAETAQDQREADAIQARIAVESQNIQLHQAQVGQIQALLAAENRVDQQRVEQMRRQDADAWADQTRGALAGWR